MSADTVAIAFTADVGQLQAGAAQAAGVVATTTKQMGAAANEAHGGFSRFTEILQHHRQQVRAESGIARVLARDLGALGFEAKGAGGEIAHMISAFAIAGPLMGGIAAFKLLVGAVQEFIESGAKSREAWRATFESIEKLGVPVEEELHRMVLKAQGWSEAMFKGLDAMKQAGTVKLPDGSTVSGYEAQVIANTKIRELTRQIHGEAQQASVLLTSIPVLGAAIADVEVTQRLARMRTELAAWKQVLHETNEEEKKIGETTGTIDRRKDAEEAKDAAEEARKAAIDEQYRQGQLTEEAMRKEIEEYAQVALAKQKIDEEAAKKKTELEAAVRKAANEGEDRDFEAAYEKEQRRLEERRKQFETFASRIGDVFARAIENGKSPAEAMKAVLKEVEKEILAAAVKFLLTKAAEAFAAAFVSQASIPVVGPALGAAEGAAAEATILGLLGSLPSYARGSYYVPNDQIAVLHKGEEVRTEQEVAFGGRGRGGPSITVVATDTQDFARAALDSGSDLSEALRQLRRSNRGAW